MNNYKKILFTFWLAFFALTGLVIPQPSHAQFADVIGGPTTIVKFIWEKVEKVYDVVQGIVGAEISNRTVGMFLDSMAYDVATQLAEGGPGGKPQFRTLSIEKTLQNAGNKALGEFIGDLTSKGFDELGINLCDPSIELKLTLTLGILDEQLPPTSRRGCAWNDVRRNWSEFGDNVQADIIKFQLNPVRSGVTSTIDFFRGIGSSESSDLGIAFQLDTELNNRKIEAEKVVELTAEECAGYLDNKTAITDEVITHCSAHKFVVQALIESAPQTEAARQLARKEAATNKKLSDILKDAGNRFVDTFTSKLMNNWIKRGMWSLFGDTNNDVYQDYRNTLIDRLRGGSNIRQPRGADIFKDIKTINIETLESFDYLNDFTICPNEFRQPDNCVMSPALLQAVNNKMTLQQAVQQGVLNGNMPFVNPNDAVNHTVDKCYRDGLCYSNLVKLRKADMVPVGWELAALRAPVSLQQAMDCFEESTKCSFDRSPDYAVDGNDHNPFYHLVDPNWVLKAPDVRCDAYVYSPILESSESSNRQQYCADPKVCLHEDPNGNCIDGQFDYCVRTENSWNFEGDSCAAGEIYSGCLTFANEEFGNNSYIEDSLEYCSSNEAGCRHYSQNQDGDGNWVLGNIQTDTNDLFLNNQSLECNETEAGCNEYIAMAPDTGANLVVNGSFDNLDNDSSTAFPDGRPDGWIDTNTGQDSDGIAYDGDWLANGYPWGTVSGAPGTESIFQFIHLVPNTSYRISASAARYNPAVASLGRVTILLCDATGNCDNDSLAKPLEGVGDCVVYAGTNNANLMIHPPDSGDMERGSCTFTTNNEVIGEARLHVVSDAQNISWFDNIKVEMISDPSQTIDASYSDYGDGARIYMNGNTVMCSADELGCQGYIPDNNDPMIPAVISQDDLCPSECVGYDTYTEQVNIFDIIEHPTHDPSVNYYNFIPETARECPAQEIGCEEFTNLDVVAEGGEGKEFFTYIRQCVGEDLGQIYYTWEGTDVSGYQIKTWYALPSGEGNPASPSPEAPCTNMDPAGSDCQDTSANIAICGPDTPETSDDPANDPNCRSFFDVDGNVYYRLQDRVIFATANCHDYRRSLTGQVYKAVPEESVSCAAINSGCREYYGNDANNVRILLADNFEQGTYDPWMEINGGTSLDLSNESLDNNGHSIKNIVNDTFGRDMRDVSLQNNKQYIVTWWMKSEATLTDFLLALDGLDNTGAIFNQPFANVSNSTFQNIEAGHWHYYTAVATITDLDNIDISNLNYFRFLVETNAANQNINASLFIDNFTVKEVENSFSVVRDSWDTPISCDTPYNGYNLGCKSYIDLNGQNFNLKSFDHLCREEAIGCIPVIDTHNSTNPFSETFHESYCSDDIFLTEADCTANGEVWTNDYSKITVPEDNLTYLVPNPNNYCSQTAKGCTELGLPDRLDETQFSTVYKINDPDKYNSILCSSEGLNCSEYNTAKGVFYFKDPGADTCTYQQNTLIDNSLLSGWFKTSTLGDEVPLGCADTDGNTDTNGDGLYDVNELILPKDYCSVSTTNLSQLPYFTKDDCETNSGHWNNYIAAAQCPANENLCTSFKDPVDPPNCDPKGKNLDIGDRCSSNLYDNEIDCTANNFDWILESRDGYCASLVYNNERDCTNAGYVWTPYCKDYYYYDNEKIDEASCNGLVDRNNGCVLFYDNNDWEAEHNQVRTIYDTGRTYQNIEVSNQASSPVNCDPSFDPSCNLTSNKLIKVSKDRQCSEWLSCKSSTASWDSKTEEYKIICDDLDTCLETQYDSDSNTTKCKTWGSYDDSVEALTFEKYQSRDTGLKNHISWSDKEYTGYSIPNLLPISKLSAQEFGEGENKVTRLVYNVTNNIDNDGAYYEGCVDGGGAPLDGQACTATINTEGIYNFRGECRDRICWVSPKANDNSTSTYAIEARAYAVADAPFPAAIEPDGVNRLSKYKMANICTNDATSPNSCELSFKRVTYGFGGQIFYYPEKASSGEIPAGICSSGLTAIGDSKAPKTCSKNSECDTTNDDGTSRGDGVCSLRTEDIVFRNWPGICLEYDLDSLVTKDVDNSYYCNQWYPAQKIQGTDSLYDNYREAGYYDVYGRDAMFCAVAEPFQLPEDRYYCAAAISVGSIQYCSVLALVPAGTKINLDMMSIYNEAILYGYLDNSLMTHHNPEDVVVDSRRPTQPFNGLGVNWLNRNNARAVYTGDPSGNHRDPLPMSTGAMPNMGSSLFYPTDFDPTNALGLTVIDTIPVLPLANLDDIFDTSESTNGDILSLYYYDTKINRDGQYAYNAGVVWPWYPGTSRELIGPRGLVQLYGIQKTDDEVKRDLNQCGPGYHESWFNDYLDGNYESTDPGFDQRGWDGHGHKEESRWCSPMSYGIYIQPSFPNPRTTRVCDETSCEVTDNCLSAISPFYASIVLPTPPATCGGDPNCEFKWCMENLTVPDHNGDGPWCSDYGQIFGDVLRVEYSCPGVVPTTEYADFENTINISPCYDKLYNIVNTPVPTTKVFNGVTCTTAAGQFYQALNVRAGINSTLITEMLGDENSTGCLNPDNSETHFPEGLNCVDYTLASGAPWYDLSKGDTFSKRRVYLDVTKTYYADITGVVCTGLECYQQCRIATQLDSEGELSAVRTDIWWRSEKTNARVRPAFPWISWYWSPSQGYVSSSPPAVDDDEVLYSNIATFPDIEGDYPENFSHFGAGLGILNLNKIVYTRVPYYSTDVDNLSAATFFSNLDGTQTLDQALDAALLEMQDIFYRTYNLNWVAAGGAYEAYNEPDLNGGNSTNPFAGPDYPPRILATCGDRLCEILDADGNVSDIYRGVTVNGTRTGTLIGLNSSLFVSAKFFYHAHPDHMPVYSVDVDWGDGPVNNFSLNPGKYKNNLPEDYCDPEKDAPGDANPVTGNLREPQKMGFAGDERACSSGYKIFYHDYIYDETGAHNCNGGSGGAYGTPAKPAIDNASCYQPRIKVMDNWKWSTIEPFYGWIVVYDN